MALRLDWCSYEAAKYACEHWYSRPEMPRGKLARIGVWENEVFKGALIFGCGTGGVANTGKKIGIGPFEIAELCRIALRGHDAQLSRIISIACKILKRSQPGLKLLVTYADPSAGHHGGIYQGAGWIYIGRSSPDAMYRSPDGELHHSRNTSSSGTKKFYGKTKAVVNQRDCVKIPLEPKYKYLLPLDEETRKKVQLMRRPYPKRVRSEPADTAPVQGVEGGSTPTRTLQSTAGDPQE